MQSDKITQHPIARIVSYPRAAEESQCKKIMNTTCRGSNTIVTALLLSRDLVLPNGWLHSPLTRMAKAQRISRNSFLLWDRNQVHQPRNEATLEWSCVMLQMIISPIASGIGPGRNMQNRAGPKYAESGRAETCRIGPDRNAQNRAGPKYAESGRAAIHRIGSKPHESLRRYLTQDSRQQWPKDPRRTH